MKSKEQKRREAKIRQDTYNKLTTQEKVVKLGLHTAQKQRAKLV